MTLRCIQNFPIGFVCSHSMHKVTLLRIQNLNGFSIGFLCSHSTHKCSHSTHKVTLQCIQNLNGFSIGFVCSHSAHKVTLRCIQNFFSIRFFCSHCDAPTYTSTTDQCGARSGSPQLQEAEEISKNQLLVIQ